MLVNDVIKICAVSSSNNPKIVHGEVVCIGFFFSKRNGQNAKKIGFDKHIKGNYV
jgi:hypothetical protein